MRCFILAAGFGKRMGDLTQNLPKPLLPFLGKTLLDHSIEFATNLGITEFIINTHYQADKIHDHLKKYSKFKMNISFEPEILGTGGGLKKGIKGIIQDNEHFLTINPDIFLLANPHDLKSDIYQYTGKCLLFLSQPELEENYTSLNLQNGKVKFQSGDFFYIGISVIQANIFEQIPENTFYDLAKLFRSLSSRNQLDGINFPGKAIDIGDKRKYLKMVNEIKAV